MKNVILFLMLMVGCIFSASAVDPPTNEQPTNVLECASIADIQQMGVVFSIAIEKAYLLSSSAQTAEIEVVPAMCHYAHHTQVLVWADLPPRRYAQPIPDRYTTTPYYLRYIDIERPGLRVI